MGDGTRDGRIANQAGIVERRCLAEQQDWLRDAILELQQEQREQGKRAGVTAELAALDERINKLKGRLKAGGDDLFTYDEVEVAIARNQAKRDEMAAALKAARASRNNDQLASIDALPQLVDELKRDIERAIKPFADPKKAHIAREATRAMIAGGRIVLRASSDGKKLEGPVALDGLGTHLLSVFKTQINGPKKNSTSRTASRPIGLSFAS